MSNCTLTWCITVSQVTDCVWSLTGCPVVKRSYPSVCVDLLSVGLLVVVVVGVIIGAALGATMLFAIALCLRKSVYSTLISHSYHTTAHAPAATWQYSDVRSVIVGNMKIKSSNVINTGRRMICWRYWGSCDSLTYCTIFPGLNVLLFLLIIIIIIILS